MYIRKLEINELFDAHLISLYCFHGRVDDVEADRERVEQSGKENWGAFTDDGTLMTRIVNNSYNFYIDGRLVKAGGIGGVSTFPEYRDSGAVKEIFKQLLPSAYASGEVISALFPFNHSFYRKRGYETVPFKCVYELKPAMLECYKTDCRAVMRKADEPADEYLALYNEFIKGFNMTKPRDEAEMLRHIDAPVLYRDRKFTYIFKKDGVNKAYVTFTDIRHEPSAILRVEEAVWQDRIGFETILAFLGRFDADYGTIELPLPYGIDLNRIIRTRRAYEIKKSDDCGFMVRVINAEALLNVISKPADCDFTIKITDEYIAENNGTWRVYGRSVSRLNDNSITADIEVSERSFAQLAVGGISLDEALLKPDVQLNAQADMLRRVFAEKKIFITEHF